MSMERQIKFRAWDNAGKKWLLGYELPNLGGFSLTGEVMLFEQWSEVINRFILQQRDRKPEDLIIMQFTGLRDKNGEEIYEGDIVKNKFEDKFIVEIKPGTMQMRKIGERENGESKSRCYNIGGEIIGNIYENENLIK